MLEVDGEKRKGSRQKTCSENTLFTRESISPFHVSCQIPPTLALGSKHRLSVLQPSCVKSWCLLQDIKREKLYLTVVFSSGPLGSAWGESVLVELCD